MDLCLRITKKEGTAIQIVKEGFEDSPVVAIKRVNELDFYNLSPSELASKLQITGPKLLALVHHLELKNSLDNYKKIKIGKTEYQRYSQHALTKLKESILTTDMEQIWNDYQRKRRDIVPS
jgi:hypothetical protein